MVNQQGHIYYKLNALNDEEFLKTLKILEEERKTLDERKFVNEKQPDIDHRFVEVYDMSQEISEQFHCVDIHVRPLTPICVFNAKEDRSVSDTLQKGYVWEQHVVQKFQKALLMHPDICVIDIGANLGQYSLIAANMGHSILAVEPYLPSLRKFHKAAQLGNFSTNIKVLQNAIFDRREMVNIKADPDAQSGAKIHEGLVGACATDSCQKVKAIHLNDIVPYVPSGQCILKLHIQGLEHRAFTHAQVLLKNVDIVYIFMEWSVLREFYVTESHQSEDKLLVTGMIEVLLENGYAVYSLVSGRELNADYWHGWPEDVVWVKRSKVVVQDLGLGNLP